MVHGRKKSHGIKTETREGFERETIGFESETIAMPSEVVEFRLQSTVLKFAVAVYRTKSMNGSSLPYKADESKSDFSDWLLKEWNKK